MATQENTSKTSSLMVIRQELNAPDFINELSKNDSFRMDMARQVAFAVQSMEKNEQLQKCTPESFKNALMNVALTGLTLNPLLQQADLIPRNVKGETVVVLDISYKGIITKMIDFGVAVDVFANVVYENDDYEYETFTNRVLVHKTWQKKGLSESGAEKYVYGCIVRPDGSMMYRELPIEHFNMVMKKSESYKASKRGDKSKHWTSIWEGEFRWQMIAKTMIKYMWKFIPKSEKMDVLGRLIEESNFAHETSETVLTETGQSVGLKNNTDSLLKHTSEKVKSVKVKGKIEEAEEVEDVEDVVIDESSVELIFNAFNEGFLLEGRSTRALPEVKEMYSIMAEKGFSRSLLEKAFGGGGGGFSTLDDFMYKAEVGLIGRLLTKVFELSQTNEDK